MSNKPEVLRKLDGNTGRRGHGIHDREDPKGTEIENNDMSPPDWIKGYGIEIWNFLAPHLISIKLLTENDVPAFATLCNEYDIYRQCIILVEEQGYTVANGSQIIPNPFLTVKNKAFSNMEKLMGKFGLTPADRAKIGLSMMNKTPENPLNDMLSPDLGKKD